MEMVSQNFKSNDILCTAIGTNLLK